MRVLPVMIEQQCGSMNLRGKDCDIAFGNKKAFKSKT